MAMYSIQDRYIYARFVYECMFAASQSGRTCFDPLLFHYPALEGAFADIESTFLVADAVKVSPVLEPLDKGETYDVFFPPGAWVDLDTFEVVNVTDPKGEMVTLTPAITVKKHLRPGYILPVQFDDIDGQKTYANST